MIRFKPRKSKVARSIRERPGRHPSVSHHSDAQDVQDLAAFGYAPELGRSLGRFSSFAAGFSYLSVLTGTTQTFYLGYGLGGPAFFWTWPIVFLGQFAVGLCFAELAAQYPLAGGVYQWSKHMTEGRSGGMAGWILLGSFLVSLVAVPLALQSTLPQLFPGFQFVGDSANPSDAARNAVLLALGLVAFSTVINTLGVKLMSRLNNFGVFSELLGATAMVVMLFLCAKRGPDIVFQLSPKEIPSGRGIGALLGASLSAAYVMFGFDTAGTLAEETHNPRATAPRAILLSLSSAAFFAMLLVLGGLMAADSLDAPELISSSGGLSSIIMGRLGHGVGRMFLLVISLAISGCTLAVHTGAVRLIFAMARDRVLPGSQFLAVVYGVFKIPARAVGLVGFIAVLLLMINLSQPKVIEIAASIAVIWANLAYLMVTVPLLSRRLRGRLKANPDPGAFRLGSWGLPVNLFAVVWGIGLVINIGWPRAEIYGDGLFERFVPLVATLLLIITGLLVLAGRPNTHQVQS